MTNLEKTQELDIIDNENAKIDEKLETIEQQIALGILNKIDSAIPKYDIDLAIDRENNRYHIIGNNKIAFNLSLTIQELDLYSDDIIKLLNFDGELQLLGGREWRAIAEKQMFGGDSNADRLVNNSHENGLSTDYYRDENNKTEELYKFIQTLKNIPEEKWAIANSIKNSGPIGI